MTCGSDIEVQLLVDGQLDATEADDLRRHLYQCEPCRRDLLCVVALDAILSEAASRRT